MLTFVRSLGQDYSPQAVRRTPPAYITSELSLTKIYRYCVRPNSGRIEPGKEVEVTGTSAFVPARI